MYCAKCGKKIAEYSRFCPECGAKIETMSSSPNQFQEIRTGTRDQTTLSELVYPKNPPTSPHHAWWNLIWPGIGHIIFGQRGKGVALMVVSFIINLIFPLVNLITILVCIVDAYKVGNCLASGKPVRKWEWFPA